MDGVLANFDSYIKDNFCTDHLTGDDASHFWNEHITQARPFTLFKPIKGGISMLKSLCSVDEEGIVILTSTGGGQHHLEIARQKLMWLEDQNIHLPVAFCMSKSTNQRQKEFVERQKNAGFVSVRVWVPPGAKKQIRDLEKKLQSGHRKNHK